MGGNRDHGGNLDNAIMQYGGDREDWIDLSTGINPVPYPVPSLPKQAWTALPDRNPATALVNAAAAFWKVPTGAAILAAPGASSLIAHIPRLADAGTVTVPAPTYNEHAASFAAHRWVVQSGGAAQAQVLVHPNNPDGKLWSKNDLHSDLTVVDESFCDVMPACSLINAATRPGTLILKSFGKFWGLAGLRLGFAIGDPVLIARLSEMLGPWPVSGVALEVGRAALQDQAWAWATNQRLKHDAARLDTLMSDRGAQVEGGTSLFRLYRLNNAAAWQDRLARHRIWSRVFPYRTDWIRLGLPAPNQWDRLEGAL
ncbi:threonine-phosphate decarboxylase CobD [uncultured Tateyamaria sp.]|uniref:threonine-phosphate decarboxylase CobD n=1 Tax=uncultured Tateyamaria sp. TaxID=455651 RepID=UPI0026388A28|nr:threonine-phosphate decarboxylase CobD [uncultured Tateyamaria sp.]